MPQLLTPDLCVIGAGPGGLAAATKAASYGVRVVLIERGHMGGQAWHTGSMASKALLASAKRAHDIKNARTFGIRVDSVSINHGAILEYALSAGQALAQNVSPERLNGLGVDVIKASARFTGPGTVEAGAVSRSGRGASLLQPARHRWYRLFQAWTVSPISHARRFSPIRTACPICSSSAAAP